MSSTENVWPAYCRCCPSPLSARVSFQIASVNIAMWEQNERGGFTNASKSVFTAVQGLWFIPPLSDVRLHYLSLKPNTLNIWGRREYLCVCVCVCVQASAPIFFLIQKTLKWYSAPRTKLQHISQETSHSDVFLLLPLYLILDKTHTYISTHIVVCPCVSSRYGLILHMLVKHFIN